jgi:hypothetical protein
MKFVSVKPVHPELVTSTGHRLYCPVDAPEALASFTRGEPAA